MARILVMLLTLTGLFVPQTITVSSESIEAFGERYFEEPKLKPLTANSELRAASVPDAQILLTQAFTLHSRPNAKKVIYLDFTGYNLSETRWVKMSDSVFDPSNQILEPYDADGNTANFSDAELQKIIDAWATVAEDFSIFDVDVTTVPPTQDAQWRTSDTDDRFGVIAAITTENNPKARACGCSGVAWANVFQRTWRSYNQLSKDYMQPAMVFTQNFYSGVQIGNIVSHEVGHNLGLTHDGTTAPVAEYYGGRDGWAPIMGSGYQQPLATWSNGDYSNASNQQDDYRVIVAGGLSFLADDFGNSTKQARGIRLNSTTYGRITSRDDLDFFSFVAKKTQTDVTVSSDSKSTDLDVKLSVFDSAGRLLQVVDPSITRVDANTATGLSASVNIPTKPNSKYFVSIDGTGFGAMPDAGYSDYGSIGTYKLSVQDVDRPAMTQGTPEISGTNLIGSTLTGAVGVWPNGATVTSSWFRNGSLIQSQGNTYVVKPEDENATITFSVFATLDNFRASRVFSVGVRVVGPISPATAPKIVGSAKVGNTLSVNKGNWKTGVQFGYQWLRNGQAIENATDPTYLVTESDLAAKISVRLTGTVAGYNQKNLVSVATSKVIR